MCFVIKKLAVIGLLNTSRMIVLIFSTQWAIRQWPNLSCFLLFCMAVITKRTARNVFISCTRHCDSSFNYYCLHRIFCQHVSFRLFVGKDGMILKLSGKRFETWEPFESVTVFSCLSLGKIQSYS